MLPAELSQLQPYFDSPVDPALLARYQLLQTGKLGEGNPDQNLIAEIAPPIDSEYDAHFEFDLNGTTSRSISQDAVQGAAIAYAKANNGLLPKDPSQLSAYLQKPVDPARIQEFLSQIPAGVTTLDQIRQIHR